MNYRTNWLLLSDRRESEQSTLAQFQAEQETGHTRVVQHEQQLREENGVLQSAEAELEKALRIVAAQSRIDDQETGVWVENHPQITGRVLSHIELPEDERAAFEAAYPEILRAFVADRLDALDLDSLPAGVRVVSKDYVKTLPAQLTKSEKPDAFTAKVTLIKAYVLARVGLSEWLLIRPVSSI